MSPDHMDALSRSLADSTSRRRLLTLLGIGVTGTAVTAAGLNEALAKKNKNNKGNVNTTFENQLRGLPMRAQGKKGTFKGTFDIVRFEDRGGTLHAVGQLTGKATGDSKKTGRGSKKTKNINQEAAFPVTVSKPTAALQAQVICEILDLKIQPIRLELLGLILTTSEIRIRLRADSEGGLLGSLLCSLAGIDLGNLGGLVDLLNDILCQLTGGTICP